MECIVLAGGLGTRLRGVIGSLPKCMAPLAGSPFLHYLLQWLGTQQVSKVVLSLGHGHQAVIDWLAEAGAQYAMPISYVIEHQPLGTGGGLRYALQACEAPTVIALNGDTYFDIALSELVQQHILHPHTHTTIALKPMTQFSRYGVVHSSPTGIITAFAEKQYQEQGNINGGIYAINKDLFLANTPEGSFSLEKDYFEKYVSQGILGAYISNGYFIDIGIPEDYAIAQNYFTTLAP